MADPKLPPITHVKEPKMKHMSTRIRWYAALGYATKEIHKRLGIRYQQVRNVLTTEPKRATREDLPPLVIETFEPVDDVDAIMDDELERSLRAQRMEDKAKRRSKKV